MGIIEDLQHRIYNLEVENSALADLRRRYLDMARDYMEARAENEELKESLARVIDPSRAAPDSVPVNSLDKIEDAIITQVRG